MSHRTLTQWLTITCCCFVLSSPAQEQSGPDVFDPFQVLTLNFEIDPETWDQIRHDVNYYDPELNIRAPALMWSDGETNKLLVEIRRKSDSALPSEADPQKVSLKVDINQFVSGQDWRGLRKLSLENGGGGNGVLREGLAMNIHRIASEHGFYNYQAGYAAWVRVVVNGNYVGLYSSPEQRDKQFMRNHGMFKPGASWLYEVNAGTFLDTTVSATNSPTWTHLCYSPFRTACAQPSSPSVAIALETDLQARVDMGGMLTLAAIESFIANTDGLFTKNGKNSFAVDFLPATQLKRRYYPWDLDAGFNDTTLNIYTGGPGPASGRKYQVDILGHYWFRDYYRHIFSDLLDGPLSPAVLTEYLNRLEQVLKPYLIEDPNAHIGSDVDSHFAQTRQYFTNRASNIRGQIGSLTGPPRFSRSAGEITPGFLLNLTHTNLTGTIYYTTDGSDPRALGGAPAGLAWNHPLTLTNTTHIRARTLRGTNWSALRHATYSVAGHGGGIKVTEIMYNPRGSTNGDAGDYEFIELKNTGSSPVDLSLCSFTGIQFTFAPGTIVSPGAIIVLVGNPVAFQQRYPGAGFHGVYFGGLAKTGERIRLRTAEGNNIFSVEYDDEPPWPQGANGMGYSLVNIDPAGDPDHPSNWRASTAVDGSPGSDDPAPPYDIGVVVNEVLTHTDAPLEDAIELYNPTANPIDISGWYLSDKLELADPARASLKKFRIPGGTVISPGGHVVFYEGQFNPAVGTTNTLVKFAFSKSGEEVWLSSANSAGDLTGHIEGFRFGAAENPVTFGRHVTTTGVDYPFMKHHTFGVSEPTNNAHFRTGAGLPNSGPRIGPVVMSEIMYHPANGGAEFVELHNLTSEVIDLSGWRLNGASFQFPNGTSIAGNGYLVLLDTTATSIEDFRSTNNVPAEVPILGNLFKLQNDGENLALFRPNVDPLEPRILVDRVRYNDKAPWPTEADGFGPSLERFPAGAYGNDPFHWRAVTAGGTPGRPGTFDLMTAIERGSRWRYHAANHDLGTAWRSSNYRDNGWMEGEGTFARGLGATKTVFTMPPDGKPATIYFRKEFSVPDEIETIVSLTLSANYDDGFIAHLNGEEVARRVLPAGEVSFETLTAAAHPAGDYELIDLSEHIGKLQRGRNVLTVGLHQSVHNDPIAVWDAALVYSIATAPAPPELHARVQSGIAVVLEWNSIPGRWYKVERSDDLVSWTEIDAGSEAEGTTMQFIDAIGAGPAVQFYRVCIVE